MLGLADELLQQGVRIYDICLWHSSPDNLELRRVARETHYPAFIVDLVDPFILVGHQGMVENVFLDDLTKRGVTVRRCHRFDGVSLNDQGFIEVRTRFNVMRQLRTFETTYLVGCDGAHSRVRKLISPDSGERDDPSKMSVWGVLDGEVDTDFPDIWTKSVVYAERFGSILIMPRERDMTRLYIEMRPDADSISGSNSNPNLVQAAIMRRAAQILQPYRITWRRVEWFGQYRVSQRVAARFAASVPTQPPPPQPPQPSTTAAAATNPRSAPPTGPRVFISGDAAHTHSPKAAQGMNTALHDSWNLAWKLNLAIRGLCNPPVLLGSYETERQKIAHDLVAFDFAHANEMSRGDPVALADNFQRNVRFISGVGVEYGANVLNRDGIDGAGVKPGCTLPPGKVSRYIDANPVDVQLDIPVLGQFRLYIFVPDVVKPAQAIFLAALCDAIADQDSLMSRLSAAASQSYLERPRVPSKNDIYTRPERYTAVSQLFAFSLISKPTLFYPSCETDTYRLLASTPKPNFELSHLPPILSRSPWTIYLDDIPDLDTQGSTCTDKYLGPSDASQTEVAILNVRPDGYVGSIKKWNLAGLVDQERLEDLGKEAATWLDDYFGGFMAVPS